MPGNRHCDIFAPRASHDLDADRKSFRCNATLKGDIGITDQASEFLLQVIALLNYRSIEEVGFG
jgi:hypothetical protein